MPVDIQLEVTDLQYDTVFKDKFALAVFDTFYQYLLPGYLKLTALAAKVCVFCDYLCEQIFPVLNINKTKLYERLTHKNFNGILKLDAIQDLTPDIDAHVKAKRHKQVLGAN